MTKDQTEIVTSVTAEFAINSKKIYKVLLFIQKDDNSCVNLYIDENPDKEYTKLKLTENINSLHYRAYNNTVDLNLSIPRYKLIIQPHANVSNLEKFKQFYETLKLIKENRIDKSLLVLHEPKGFDLRKESVSAQAISEPEKVKNSVQMVKEMESKKLELSKKRHELMYQSRMPYNTLDTPSNRITDKDRRVSLPLIGSYAKRKAVSFSESDDSDEDPVVRKPLVPKSASTPATAQAKKILAETRPSVFYSRPALSEPRRVKFMPFSGNLGGGASNTSPIVKIEASDRTPLSIVSNFKRTNENNSVKKEGFQNVGNSCYVNAVLQALTNIKIFVKELTSPVVKSQNLKDDSFYKTFVSVLDQKSIKSVVTPDKLLETVQRITKGFASFRQEDADEFLRTVLDLLSFQNIDEDKENNTLATAQPKEKVIVDPVKINFEFSIERSVMCLECSHESVNASVYRDIPLFIPKNNSEKREIFQLPDLVKAFFQNDKVDYVCEKCKSTEAMVCQWMKKLPRVLVLELKRFDLDEVTFETIKRHEQVYFPDRLDLSKVCKKESIPPEGTDEDVIIIDDDDDDDDDISPSYSMDKTYKLVCLISHIGSTSASGHYICDVYDEDKKIWQCYNDSYLEEVGDINKLNSLRKNTGYILFYVHNSFF